MSQERKHGGGKPGRASVTCSPDSGGMHSLIGAIDPPRSSFATFLLAPKAREVRDSRIVTANRKTTGREIAVQLLEEFYINRLYTSPIRSRERLGGWLTSDYREAA